MSDRDSAPTIDELPALAKDVTYEFCMARLAVEKLRAVGSPGVNDLEWSAWVEVLLLHGRVLADFFGKAPTGDDLSAGHYVDDWDLGCADIEWIRSHVRPINKRVLHLTAYRHRQRATADAPEIEELLTRLTRTLLAFLDALPADRRSWFPIVVTSD